MLGLDGSGKTTALYKLITNDTITTTPTYGFNIESLEHNNVVWNIWDLVGNEKVMSYVTIITL
jgi:GTPase SAR1 family protein